VNLTKCEDATKAEKEMKEGVKDEMRERERKMCVSERGLLSESDFLTSC
jgi:hypothetical protein